MLPVVHVRFEVDCSVEEAWGIAEGLEQAAISRDYRSCVGWVESPSDRQGVLGSEEAPPTTSAVTEDRRSDGGTVTAIGDVDGDVIQVRHYGDLD